jgi:hypothetical protein
MVESVTETSTRATIRRPILLISKIFMALLLFLRPRRAIFRSEGLRIG